MNMTNKLDHIRHNILDRLGARWEYWAEVHEAGWDNLTLWERVLCRIDTLRDHRDEALLHTVNWLQHHYHSLLQLLASVLCVITACSGIVTFASLAYGNGPIFLSSLIALIITGALYRYTESSIPHNQ